MFQISHLVFNDCKVKMAFVNVIELVSNSSEAGSKLSPDHLRLPVWVRSTLTTLYQMGLQENGNCTFASSEVIATYNIQL